MASGEDRILKIINKYFPNLHKNFVFGRGDDCALLNIPLAKGVKNASDKSHLQAISSDIFTQNTHFRSSYFTPAQIGHKALAVNISDLASSGARPSAFVLNLTLTDEEDENWLEEFFCSMSKLSQQYNMGLCGGDLAKAPVVKGLDPKEKSGLNISITVLGDYSHGGLPLFRHKHCTHIAFDQNMENSENIAREHDVIFVIGEIGLARVGLFALEQCENKQDIQRVLKKYPKSCHAHLSPKPLVAEGLFLSKFALNTPIFLMDISDGLMRDIPRLLKRQGILEKNNYSLGADLFLNIKNLDDEIMEFCSLKGQDPIDFAYQGGEDYALLGICAKESFELLEHSFSKENFAKLWKIGEVLGKDLLLNQQIVEEKGFDHFCQ